MPGQDVAVGQELKGSWLEMESRGRARCQVHTAWGWKGERSRTALRLEAQLLVVGCMNTDNCISPVGLRNSSVRGRAWIALLTGCYLMSMPKDMNEQ